MWKNLNSITSKLFHLNLRETITIPTRAKGEITQHSRHNVLPKRITSMPVAKKPLPYWFVRKERNSNDSFITPANKEFISEVVTDQYGEKASIKGVTTFTKSVNENQLVELKDKLVETKFNTKMRRCGVLARKIGHVRMYRSDGKKMIATMLQIDDNHVIKYYEPSEFQSVRPTKIKNMKKFGCVMVGAGSADPSVFTKEYCGLFKDSGVIPKRVLGRFWVTADAKLAPGTPLNASHFRVGDYVDCGAITVNRGFQGVMKRFGFKGMPATHGVTKTHRRPGNIGSGGQKARVWPGTKMPGIMGGRRKTIKGMKIVRINYENNVIFVAGASVPGEFNNIVHVMDTMLKLKRKVIDPPVPTSLRETEAVDVYAEGFHNMEHPTIQFEAE